MNLDWEPYFEIADTRRAVPREAARVRGDRPASASRPTSSRSSAPSTCRTSTRSRGSSSAPTIAQDAVRQKVAALFPAHEVEQFTELFWERIQRWRARRRPGESAERDVPSSSTRWYSERRRARRHARALGHVRHAGARRSRPPAATPRRSSASTSSTRCASCSTPGGSRSTRATASTGGSLLTRRGRQRPPGVDPAPVPRVHPPRGRAGDPQRLRVRRHRDRRRRARRSARSTRSPCVCRFPDVFTRAHLHERHLRPAPLLRRPGRRRLPAVVAAALRARRSTAPHLERLRQRFVLLASGEGANEDIGESWRVAARARQQGHPEPGRLLGPGVAPRLADVAGDAAAVPGRAGLMTTMGDADGAGRRPTGRRAHPLDAARPAGARAHARRAACSRPASRRIGAEQEMFLVDGSWQPAPGALAMLAGHRRRPLHDRARGVQPRGQPRPAGLHRRLPEPAGGAARRAPRPSPAAVRRRGRAAASC